MTDLRTELYLHAVRIKGDEQWDGVLVDVVTWGEEPCLKLNMKPGDGPRVVYVPRSKVLAIVDGGIATAPCPVCKQPVPLPDWDMHDRQYHQQVQGPRSRLRAALPHNIELAEDIIGIWDQDAHQMCRDQLAEALRETGCFGPGKLAEICEAVFPKGGP